MSKPPLTLLLLLFSLCALNAADSARDAAFSKELERVCNTRSKVWTLTPGGELSRRLDAPLNQTFDLRSFDTLSLNALRADRTTGGLRLRWVLHSRSGGVYQSTQAKPVSNAAPGPVSVLLRPEHAGLVPMGHQRPWDDLAAAEIVRVEVRAECSFNSDGEALTVNLTQVVATPRKNTASAPELTGLRLLSAPQHLRAEAQLLFRLNPMPADPFAVDGEGDVRIQLPDGSQALAYLDQDYIFRDDGSAARATPVGAPYFRANILELPARGTLKISSGPHVWNVEAETLRALLEPLRESQNSTAIPPPGRWTPALTASIPAETPHGLPRVCSLLNAKGRFEPLARSAPTMPCWRPVPFWTSDWGGFSGTLQPNLELAARMDGELKGEQRPLLLFDGATLGRTGPFNWLSHPARGSVNGPGELYRTEEGERFLRRWIRYALARWSSHQSVSELWLALENLAPGDAAFYARLAPSLATWSPVSKPRETSRSKPGNLFSAPPIYALHPFAADAGLARTIATFNGKDIGSWFADTRQGKSVGGHSNFGSDGPHAIEIRARTATETSIGLTTDYTRIPVTWNQMAPDNFAAGDTLLLDILVPADAPPDLRAGIHLRDRDGLWYQTLLPGMPNPGDWCTLALDLSGRNAHGLSPIAHTKPWNDYSRQRLCEIGLHVFSTHINWVGPDGGNPQALNVKVDHIRLARRPSPAEAKIEFTVLQQRLLRRGAEAVDLKDAAIGDLYECDVTLNRTFENPFDPTQCDFSASLSLPSGKTVRVPLFFNQPCERSEAPGSGDEVVVPLGREFFTLRYRILEAGAHRVTLELREGSRYDVQRKWFRDTRFTPDGRAQVASRGRGGSQYPERFDDGKRVVEKVNFIAGPVSAKLELGAPAFTASTAAKENSFKGFVRTAEDRRHFQFDDGSFYYPLGPCVRSPSDQRIAYLSEKWSPEEIARLSRRGTYQYDDYFAAYEKAGINWMRVWMCPWWGALEWRRDWPGYQGVGRYNLLNAWRVDHLLAEAERRGIYISLCLTNHGQYSIAVDSEWINNPYNARLGGPLIAASEFFSRGDAKILHQNKLRYILARYGHSPAVASWSLFSELEWTEEYEYYAQWRGGGDEPAPLAESWHTEMAGFLHENDVNRHLTLTHFSHPTHGENTLALPAVDIAASNAYSAFQEFGEGRMDAAFALSSYWSGLPGKLKGMSHLNKPVLVEEQGRHWMGGERNTERELRADLHTQLWGSMVQPLAGATGYWWWVQLHIDNRYEEYAALARFMKGEDFRPSKGENNLEPAFRGVPTPNGQLHARALKSNKRLYGWVYHPRTPYGEETRPVSEGEIRVGNLEPGAYKLEIWDTYRGEKTEERDITIAPGEGGKGQSILFKLPTVNKDLAFKLKPVGK